MKLPRLPDKERLVLQMLIAESRGLYGLELVKRSGGQLKRGSVYVLLSRLEDRGYVEAKRVNPPEGVGGKPRRLYVPTGAGQRIFEAYEMMIDHLGGAHA